jgi:hypothetical protein
MPDVRRTERARLLAVVALTAFAGSLSDFEAWHLARILFVGAGMIERKGPSLCRSETDG